MNFLFKVESGGFISFIDNRVDISGTHFNDETSVNSDGSSVSELVSWGVLKRSDGSAGNVFTLRVKISH
jgi:hypothetical protein